MTTEMIIHIFIAAILGGIIGLEREYRAKEAGLRTHLLVASGSALFMIISQYGFDSVLHTRSNVSLDPSRIASQVVTGIGFIGAGTIIFQKHVIKGLTTAAGLWVTSAIGLACGSGMYILSTATTIMVVICLEAIYYITVRFGTKNIEITFSLSSYNKIESLIQYIENEKIIIQSYKIHRHVTDGAENYLAEMDLKIKNSTYQHNFPLLFNKLDGITVKNIE